ncbi:MAG: 6-carboxytetrahydropterin synthase [bacterium]|nr:6-carboxytetrahydropterin synthase [bacterium]
MFEIRWETIVDSAHRLYEHTRKCAFLHGHSYRIKLRMGGKVSGDGILVDFGLLKEKIHNLLDHKVILNRKDPLVDVLKTAGQKLVVLDRNPSAENLALLCCSIILSEFENVSWVEAEVFETPNQSGFVSMERGDLEKVEYEVTE